MNWRILVAATDEDYAMSVIAKLCSGLDKNTEYTAVTNYGYLSEYINGGYADEDILIIDEEFFKKGINQSKFETIIVVARDEKKGGIYEVRRIYMDDYILKS